MTRKEKQVILESLSESHLTNNWMECTFLLLEGSTLHGRKKTDVSMGLRCNRKQSPNERYVCGERIDMFLYCLTQEFFDFRPNADFQDGGVCISVTASSESGNEYEKYQYLRLDFTL